METSDEATFFEWLHHAGYYPALTPASREMLIGAFLQTASRHLGPIFYRLVESLFNAVGVPARRSNPGDTSNRIDLILTDEVEPLPVEIKSRTEVPAINVKSIQQALENKLTITRLYGRAELSSSSSLVVGFDYPADRTGILELIDDIDSSFGIRIGMVSLRRLYELFLASNLDDVPVSRNALATLKGPL